LPVLYEVRTDSSVYHRTEEEKMIYTKTKLKDGTAVCSPVTAANTYTHCAKCGKEVKINLQELILAGVADPYDTEVNCSDCTEEMMHWSDLDMNEVACLVKALKGMGYGAVLQELLDDFDVENVSELFQEECEFFLDDLFDKIAEARHEK
jgi:hypothetical protein